VARSNLSGFSLWGIVRSSLGRVNEKSQAGLRRYDALRHEMPCPAIDLSYSLLSLIRAKLVLGVVHATEDCTVIIGERLRALRKQKNFSQGEIEKRTGLLRCYTSRVERGHTIPNLETLEKYARALEIPMYKLFYEGEEPLKLPKLLKRETADTRWGSSGKDADMVRQFCRLFSRMEKGNRELILFMARKMTNGRAARKIKAPRHP
jgi:transcriptional regulator with XRE-family HTH domain